MKRILYLALSALLLAACGETEKEKPVVTELTLSVSPTTPISFQAKDESTKFITITTTGSWTATPAANWIHLDKNTGSGDGSISVTVEENTEDLIRNANILIISSLSGQERQASVQVKQSGNGRKAVEPKPAAFDGNKRASTTYQLLIYSFADGKGNDGIGDFKGIQDNLDYLDGLGVTALWLSPAHPTGSYHGYDVNDYFGVNSKFGTEAEFKELIDAAHAKGIKIYMDYVLNHSGTGTEWFKSVKADPKNSPYRDYYVLSDGDYPSEAIGGMGGWVSLGGASIGYKGRLHFKVDWTGTTKYVTVTETTEAAQSPNTSGAKRWIHIGSKGSLGMYETATNIFELTLDVDTDWGFLVRTSNDDSWPSGTKYGGKAGKNVITLGQPFPLDNTTAADIVFGESTSYWASFDASMPDLNYGKPDECEKSRAFQSTVESAVKWVNLGVDGFRLDAVIWVYASNLSANQKFLSKWYNAVNEAYKAAGHTDDIFMVGEAWEGHGTEKQYYKGLISNFEFEYFGDLTRAVNNGQGSGFASTVAGYIKDHVGQRDQKNSITSIFMTNHDQNRASESFGKDLEKEKQAAAMLLTSGGKPFIYQGEELGYWGKKDNGDEYVRAPIVWDAAASKVAKKGVNNKVDNSMLKGSISVETQSADENSLLNTYQTWSRLRNTYPALAQGEMTTTSISDSSIASWYMTAGSQKLLVIHNVGSKEKTLKDVGERLTKPVALLGTAFLTDEGLVLSAHSSVVFEL